MSPDKNCKKIQLRLHPKRASFGVSSIRVSVKFRRIGLAISKQYALADNQVDYLKIEDIIKHGTPLIRAMIRLELALEEVEFHSVGV